MTLKSLLAVLAVGLVATMATAHEMPKGPNGGKVAEIAGHHLELTHQAADVTIYASEGGQEEFYRPDFSKFSSSS